MFKKEEITGIIVITLILSFLTSLGEPMKNLLYALLSFFIIILVNSLAKKITAFYLESEITLKIWEARRFGYRSHHYFKKPFPAGAIIPFISKIFFFPLNNLIWMASLSFDVESKTYRASKRHGLYSFSEITENHIGLIAAAGIFGNLFFAVIAYLIGFPQEMEFIQLSLLYSLFNLIPWSNLDGNKLFFGNLVLWALIATITLLGIVSTLFII